MTIILKCIADLNSLSIPGVVRRDETPMQIFVKMWNGETISLDLTAGSDVEHVQALLYSRQKRLTVAGKQLETGSLKHHNIQKQDTIFESGRLHGGAAKIIKKALKKEEHVSVIKNAVCSKHRKSYGITEQVPKTPTILESVLEAIAVDTEKVEKDHKSSNDAAFKALKKLSDDDLAELLRIVDLKASGEKQEDRLGRLAYGVFPNLAVFDTIIERMQHAKSSAVANVAAILMSEYGIVKSDCMVFNLELLRRQAFAQQCYRLGIEQQSSGSAAAPAEAAEETAEADMPASSSCVIG